jgi:pimeloyl-ACP methyl ester carboxylesterase
MIPFSITIDDNDIEDLRCRIRHTRWPDALAGVGWKYGIDDSFLRRFLQQWEVFDWRRVEHQVNALDQFILEQERTDLHIVRMKSGARGAVPIILCHGWPSSFLEMMALARCLSSLDKSEDSKALAFDVVIPSLPGFGFSRPKLDRAWDLYAYCDCLFQAMTDLGYPRFAVHAYDIAASIMSLGAFRFPERIIGYHTTEPGIPAPILEDGSAPLSEDEEVYLRTQNSWDGELGAYRHLLRTKPQTVAYGLSDSPAATAAWILEKWKDWTDPDRPLEESIPLEHLLAQASLFWFTNSLNSANRFYLRDKRGSPWLRTPGTKIHVPTGVTLNATQAIEHAPREYASRTYTDIRYWKQLSEGGHFISCEKPALVAMSIREFLSKVVPRDSTRPNASEQCRSDGVAELGMRKGEITL